MKMVAVPWTAGSWIRSIWVMGKMALELAFSSYHAPPRPVPVMSSIARWKSLYIAKRIPDTEGSPAALVCMILCRRYQNLGDECDTGEFLVHSLCDGLEVI